MAEDNPVDKLTRYSPRFGDQCVSCADGLLVLVEDVEALTTKMQQQIDTLQAQVIAKDEEIAKFWSHVEHGWDIEPREFFEREAKKQGFGSALAMAAHHMWKRELLLNPQEMKAYDAVLRRRAQADAYARHLVEIANRPDDDIIVVLDNESAS